MPQVTKGGKFIFGWSQIKPDGTVIFPKLAADEYQIASEGKIFLFTGSKSTGGFCVTRKGLLLPSQLSHILIENSDLLDYTLPEGTFIAYKGRKYGWLSIGKDGSLVLPHVLLDRLRLRPGDRLLSIRSSDIAFTMGAYGPLVERANRFDREIPCF